MDKNRQRNRVMKRRKMSKERKNMHSLPAYKAAYELFKECRFRFRTVSKNCKGIAHDVLEKLLDVMVDIELVYWQVEDKKRLAETYRTVLKVIIIIRSMHDAGELSTQHYSVISQYSAELSKHMGNWNKTYNKNTMIEEKEETEEGDRQNAVDS